MTPSRSSAACNTALRHWLFTYATVPPPASPVRMFLPSVVSIFLLLHLLFLLVLTFRSCYLISSSSVLRGSYSFARFRCHPHDWMAEFSSHLGCYAVIIGKYLPTFSKYRSAFITRVKQSNYFLLESLTFKMKTLRSIGKSLCNCVMETPPFYLPTVVHCLGFFTEIRIISPKRFGVYWHYLQGASNGVHIICNTIFTDSPQLQDGSLRDKFESQLLYSSWGVSRSGWTMILDANCSCCTL
jgi:hypothetical protein